jgi:hypothetical protein
MKRNQVLEEAGFAVVAADIEGEFKGAAHEKALLGGARD